MKIRIKPTITLDTETDAVAIAWLRIHKRGGTLAGALKTAILRECRGQLTERENLELERLQFIVAQEQAAARITSEGVKTGLFDSQEKSGSQNG